MGWERKTRRRSVCGSYTGMHTPHGCRQQYRTISLLKLGTNWTLCSTKVIKSNSTGLWMEHCHGKHMARASKQITAEVGDRSRQQEVARSGVPISWLEWQEMFWSLPHTRPIRLVQSAYVASLMRGDDTRLVSHQHRILYERQNQLGMHMYGFRVILRNICPGRPWHSHQPACL